MFGLPKRKPRKAGVRKTVQSKLRTKKTTKGKPHSATSSVKTTAVKKATRGRPRSAPPSRRASHSAKASVDKPIGEVTHYFGNIKVAVIKFKKPFIRGDRIAIRGATTDFTQVVQSMQLEHAPIDRVKRGQEVGLKVKKRVRQGDSVFGA